MDARERLAVWLNHNGFAVQARAGREFVRVDRKKHGPMKIYLRLTVSGWIASGDRKSHRSRALEAVIAEFNDAERIVSGADGDRLDARIRARLAEQPDCQVQEMADFYRSQPPLTLSDVGRAFERPYPAKPFVMYPNLSSLVGAMRIREICMAEPARRDALIECHAS